MLYSNFYFVVQRYTTEIVVQYVWGIAIAAGMLFVTALMALMIDAQKDMRVDMGVSFPYPGPCDRTKASTVLPRWECSIAVSEVTVWYGAVLTSWRGMMRGVSETGVLRRYGEGVLGDIRIRGWFVRMGVIVLGDVE